LDASHFLNAVRYVEQNPVRAGLVPKAEHFRWSSAAAHCGLREDYLLEPVTSSSLFAGIACWSTWLALAVADDVRKRLRQHEGRNLPCGADEFVDRVCQASGRDMRLRPRGGQRKNSVSR
jgi:putative transposase